MQYLKLIPIIFSVMFLKTALISVFFISFIFIVLANKPDNFNGTISTHYYFPKLECKIYKTANSSWIECSDMVFVDADEFIMTKIIGTLMIIIPLLICCM